MNSWRHCLNLRMVASKYIDRALMELADEMLGKAVCSDVTSSDEIFEFIELINSEPYLHVDVSSNLQQAFARRRSSSCWKTSSSGNRWIAAEKTHFCR